MEKTRGLADNIVQFISEFTPVLESSTVNFYTSNMWDHNLDCEFASQLLLLTDADLAGFPTGRILLHNEHNTLDRKFPVLREFVKQMLTNRLDTLTLHVDCVAEICLEKSCSKSKDGINEGNSVERDARRSGQEQARELLNAAVSQEQESKENTELTKLIMGKKKSHEVALMAQKCANMLCTTGIKQVVDIGSGKGYLGQFLSMQYGINVISVDSSETNTNGALKRSNRLSKQWRGIVKNATQRRKESDAESACNIQDCRTVGRSKRCSEETCGKDGTDRCLVDLTRNGEGDHLIANGVNEIIISERTASLSSSTASISTPVQSSSLQDDTSQSVENSSSVMPSSVPVTLSQLPSSSSSPLTSSSPFSTSVSSFVTLASSSSSSSTSSKSSSSSTLSSSISTLVTSVSASSSATSDPKLSSLVSKTSPPPPNPPFPHPSLVSLTPRALSLPQDDDSMESQTDEEVPDDSILSQETDSLVVQDTPVPKSEVEIGEEGAKGKMPAAFASVTGYIDEETEIGDFLQCDENARHFDLTQPFMMVGLHTCGDLAPSMLRIFHSNPSMHCLCNVGCCYHHVTEEFARIDEWDREHPGVKMGSSYGFPMSAYLKKTEVALGRGARMTACMAADRIASEKTVDVKGLFYRAVLQAADRIASEKTVDVKGLFYRAVLQVICRDRFIIPTRKQIIGKLAPKCKSFLEYTRKALRKLKMDNSKISDDEISVYEAKYRPYYRHLAAYNQLRAALAPSIEALILLDRLLYLKEQSNIKTASIVRLFDPVTSPRCYGIMAVKEYNC